MNETKLLPHRDLYPIIKKKIQEDWQREWENVKDNKLRQIKYNVREWLTSHNKHKKLEVIITRLRIGQTRLTHGHLMEAKPQDYCLDCIVPLSVEHVLVDSPNFAEERMRCFSTSMCTELIGLYYTVLLYSYVANKLIKDLQEFKLCKRKTYFLAVTCWCLQVWCKCIGAKSFWHPTV